MRSGYDFGYQGQYSEKDGETGLNHFEARDYDPRIVRWHCPDPAGQYWSPYLAFGNNPVNKVDPDGRDDSPIFDKLGNFLGTDSEGMTGSILVFEDASKFTQGMDHDLAMSISGGLTFDNYWKNVLSFDIKNLIVNAIGNETILPNGTVLTNKDFYLWVRTCDANADYESNSMNRIGRHGVSLDFTDYEYTVENIRDVIVHEIYGHGIMGWGDRFLGGGSHHKCYMAQIQSTYFSKTTKNYQQHSFQMLNNYYQQEVNSGLIQPMPNNYWKTYNK